MESEAERSENSASPTDSDSSILHENNIEEVSEVRLRNRPVSYSPGDATKPRIPSFLGLPKPYLKPSESDHVQQFVFKSFQAPESPSPKTEKTSPFGKPPIAPKPVFLRARSSDM